MTCIKTIRAFFTRREELRLRILELERQLKEERIAESVMRELLLELMKEKDNANV